MSSKYSGLKHGRCAASNDDYFFVYSQGCQAGGFAAHTLHVEIRSTEDTSADRLVETSCTPHLLVAAGYRRCRRSDSGAGDGIQK